MNEFLFNFLILLLSGTLVSFLFGLVAYPLSNYFYSKYEDGGFNLGKIIGLFCIGFIYFCLVTTSSFLPLHIFKLNSYFSWAFSLIIFLVLQRKFLNLDLKEFYLNFNIKKILKFELLFTLIFASYLFFNFLSFSSLVGKNFVVGETIMNVAILNKIQIQEALPLKDFWLAGNYLNYYYFGHVVFSQFQIFNQIDAAINYYLIASLIPPLLGVPLYIFVKKYVQKFAFISLLILFGLGPIPALTEFLSIPAINSNIIYLVFKNYFIRTMPDAIAENFSFTFVYIPVHAHVFSLLIGLVIIYQLRHIFEEGDFIKFTNKKYLFLFTFLGFSFLTNTWDFLFYLGITSFYLLINFWDTIKKDYKEPLVHIELLSLLSIFISLPWFLFYQSPSMGIQLVQDSSSFFEFFGFWQVYFFIIVSYLVINFLKKIETFDKLNLIWVGYCLLILIFLEILFFADATQKRYNTYYKFSNQILLVFTIISSIYFSKIIEFKKFYLLKIVLTICVTISSSVLFISLLYKLDENYLYNLYNFYDLREKLLVNAVNSKDYIEAIEFLRKTSNPKKSEVILETSGFGYTADNVVSALTGLDSVMGWKNHELTWRYSRGIYDFVINLESEIDEVYQGEDLNKSKDILKKHKVNYLLVGPAEYTKYIKLNNEKIEKLGQIIFKNNSIRIYQIKSDL